MDLINADKRQAAFEQRAFEVRQKCAGAGWEDVQVFATSIWDETLYTAWSEIVSTLNPHVASLAVYLSRFANICCASEVILFEKTTMLVISQGSPHHNQDAKQHATKDIKGSRDSSAERREDDWPEDRFARISQAIKLFRVGCQKLRSEFSSMEIKQHTYTAVFEILTLKTYILVITTDQGIGESSCNANRALKGV